MSQNYKDTLNLPKTEFPMKANLVNREPEMLANWERSGLYQAIQTARSQAPLFVLHDGPPFANGDVHMGTALNKILKDFIVKSRTMFGYRAPFVPGWDCHGLPIEFKVVKETRGLTPLAVRQKSEELARKFIDIQRRQFKRLGVFGDWANPYLTMEPKYEAEIIRAFGAFVAKDLVYQSKKPVYWSTGAQTALAEAEVEYADREDPAIFVEFPLVTGPLAGKASMAIWTTTPWTLPANVAIALHPRERYEVVVTEAAGKKRTLMLASKLRNAVLEAIGGTLVETGDAYVGADLAGWEAQHPFLGRTSKVIAADFVTMETGTGAVHIAPGHGADDYQAGLANQLPLLSPVDERGRYTDEAGVSEWVGKYVFDANADVLECLKARGFLLAASVYTHSYPHCWRSKTPVVFRAVEQFFIRIDKLRPALLAEIDRVQWLPHWGRNRIYGTIESRPDWCISRQRSWGVPLPVFYDADAKPVLKPEWIAKVADLVAEHGSNIWFELDDAAICSKLGLPEGLRRRNDTLDVWIDSGVSHEAVLRKHPDLACPADVYLEATDQHRGWFNSSLTTSVAMTGQSPYKTCITHGFVVDVDGKKISKSSSYQKPMDAEHFVGKHGADIVRLWVSSVNFTDEVPFSEEMFTRLSDAYRRIRNTLRILLANLSDYQPGGEELTVVDRWVLGRLQELIKTCREAYENYEFHKVYHALNQFCAVDLSSIYVDLTKDRMYCDAVAAPRRRGTQSVMHRVLDAMTRLAAPILAFTAEEAWGYFGKTESVHLQLFPEADESLIDPVLNAQVQTWMNLRAVIAQAVEQARQEKRIGNALEAAVTLEVSDPAVLGSLQGLDAELEEFFILSELKLKAGSETKATIEPISHKKCQRCWRFRPSVGRSALHSELCERCEEVVS